MSHDPILFSDNLTEEELTKLLEELEADEQAESSLPESPLPNTQQTLQDNTTAQEFTGISGDGKHDITHQEELTTTNHAELDFVFEETSNVSDITINDTKQSHLQLEIEPAPETISDDTAEIHADSVTDELDFSDFNLQPEIEESAATSFNPSANTLQKHDNGIESFDFDIDSFIDTALVSNQNIEQSTPLNVSNDPQPSSDNPDIDTISPVDSEVINAKQNSSIIQEDELQPTAPIVEEACQLQPDIDSTPDTETHQDTEVKVTQSLNEPVGDIQAVDVSTLKTGTLDTNKAEKNQDTKETPQNEIKTKISPHLKKISGLNLKPNPDLGLSDKPSEENLQEEESSAIIHRDTKNTVTKDIVTSQNTSDDSDITQNETTHTEAESMVEVPETNASYSTILNSSAKNNQTIEEEPADIHYFKASKELQSSAGHIQEQIKALKIQLRLITDTFRSISDTSADMISQTRHIQNNSLDDFSISYEQMHELRKQIIKTRKDIGDLPSMLDLVEESLESDLYVAETRDISS